MGATMVKNGNLLDGFPSQGTLHVVMLGLDSAGKTTALYRLKFDQYLNTVPTIGFNCEKVHGTVGKAKGVQFLVWDVGGQEKLRPLWRSYTRCTDGILFVVDSVDTERMEEAKMELMRTTKCPDNEGVPVLILANKQDLPNACSPKDLEKFLGVHELQQSTHQVISSCSTANLVDYNVSNATLSAATNQVRTPSDQCSKTCACSLSTGQHNGHNMKNGASNSHFLKKHSKTYTVQVKNWHIQPACAITGEGLQEGLEALYDMILKRRKINKSNKKKR